MVNEAHYKPKKHNGNGSTRIFGFDFKIFRETDILVIVENGYGAQRLLALGRDYSVEFSLEYGGSVTTILAPLEGEKVFIARKIPLEQEASYSTSPGFSGSEIEKSFDSLCAMAQDLEYTMQRTIKVSIGSEMLDLSLPSPDAGKTLKWKADLSGLQNSDVNIDEIDTSIELAHDYMEQAKESANEAIGADNHAMVQAELAQAAAASINPASGKAGQVLKTDGQTSFWADAHTPLCIKSANRNPQTGIEQLLKVDGGEGVIPFVRPNMSTNSQDGITVSAVDIASSNDKTYLLFDGKTVSESNTTTDVLIKPTSVISFKSDKPLVITKDVTTFTPHTKQIQAYSAGFTGFSVHAVIEGVEKLVCSYSGDQQYGDYSITQACSEDAITNELRFRFQGVGGTSGGSHMVEINMAGVKQQINTLKTILFDTTQTPLSVVFDNGTQKEFASVTPYVIPDDLLISNKERYLAITKDAEMLDTQNYVISLLKPTVEDSCLWYNLADEKTYYRAQNELEFTAKQFVWLGTYTYANATVEAIVQNVKTSPYNYNGITKRLIDAHKDGWLGRPDYSKAINQAFDVNYSAPSDGYVYVYGAGYEYDVSLAINGFVYGIGNATSSARSIFSIFMPVSEGDVYKGHQSGSYSLGLVRFIPVKGAR